MSGVQNNHEHHELADYLAGRVDDGTRSAIDAHLKGCVSCREQAAELRTALGALPARSFSDPPPSYFSTVPARVRMRLEQPRRGSWIGSPIIARVLAPLATAVVVIAILVELTTMERSAMMEEQSVLADLPAESRNLGLDALHAQYFFDHNLRTQDLAASLLPLSTLHSEFALLLMDAPIEATRWTDIDTRKLLGELTEQELERVLERLQERTFL
jgi:hypothetical protein